MPHDHSDDIDVTERINERVNRARLALEMRRGAKPLAVYLLGILLALGCAFYVAKNVSKTVYTPTREVAFEVENASSVLGGGRQDVRFKGVDAGKITKVELRDGHAVIHTKIYKDVGPIYRDATATLRPNSALEDMFIDITDRGTAKAGPLGAADVVPKSQTKTAAQVEDVLSAFDPDTRTHLATTLRDLGGGLGERGDDLKRAFVALVPFVEGANRLASQLARRADLTKQLVHNTSQLTGALGQRESLLRRLVSNGGTTLRTLEERDASLDATLVEFPKTLAAIDSSFAAVSGVLPSLDTALDELGPAAARLPDGLAAVRSLSVTARPAVRALRSPVRRLRPLANTLRPVTDQLDAALAALRPQTRAIDHVTRTTKSCAVAIQAFFQWTASLTKFDDETSGPGGRGDLNLGLDSSGANSDPNVYKPASCAPGEPIGGRPGTGGDQKP